MVIEDTETRPSPSRASAPSHDETYVAAPLDRLAAQVIDLSIVLLPPLLVALSPFRRVLTEAILLENQFRFASALMGGLGVALVLVIAYQTILVRVWGATLGKMFFGLHVVDVWDRRRPSWGKAFVRSLSWIGCALFLLALPFIEVLSNRKRRTVPDRIADTEVISVRPTEVPLPTHWEKSLAQSVIAVFVSAVLLVVMFETLAVLTALRTREHVSRLMEEDGELCEAVGAAVDAWPADQTREPDRLAVAMALFAAGTIEKNCLAAEVDFQFQGGHETDLAYLANSFVHAEDAELSNEYLDKVCAVRADSDACVMSRIVDAWSDERWPEVEDLFRGVWKTAEDYVSVWAIRHFITRERYDGALETIEHVSPRGPLASFLNRQRAKAYWGLKRFAEARAVVAAAIEWMDEDDRLDLASWMCFEETALGCAARDQTTCRIVESAVADSPQLLGDARMALSHMHTRACQSGGHPDYGLLSRQITHPDVRKLAVALGDMRGENAALAESQLRELTNDSSLEKVVRGEALRALIHEARRPEELHDLLTLWADENYGLEWEKSGKAFFRKFLETGKFSESFLVGRRLYPHARDDEFFQKGLIISAYQTGHLQYAWSLFREGFGSTSTNPGRMPSSLEGFAQIKAALERKFGAR